MYLKRYLKRHMKYKKIEYMDLSNINEIFVPKKNKNEYSPGKLLTFENTTINNITLENTIINNITFEKNDYSPIINGNTCEKINKQITIKEARKNIKIELLKHEKKNPTESKFIKKIGNAMNLNNGKLNIEEKLMAFHKYHKGRDDTLLTCSFCKSYIIRLGKIIYKLENNVKNYKCCICEEKFNELKKFKNHMFSHSIQSPYICKLCGYETKNMYHFSVHIKRCKITR